MSIGIMTWFRHENYGTVLQASAIFHVIEQMGFAPMMIDYVPQEKSYSLLRKLEYLSTNLSIRLAGGRYESKAKKDRFDDFLIGNLRITDSCSTGEELRRIADLFEGVVCGSDQIWSPLNFDSHYFLDFVKKSIKKISYAPSFGTNVIKDNTLAENIKGLVEKFNFLSVREVQGQKLLKELTGREIPVVLDPTLLLDGLEWQKLLDLDGARNDDRYILAYFLGINELNWKIVNSIIKASGVKCKVLPVFCKDFDRGYECIRDAGPKEFAELISGAEMVLTDSYHGMLFSIIFNKQFYVFERFKKNSKHNQNSRIYSFVEKYGLKDRLVNDAEIAGINNEIDYEILNAAIKWDREKSVAYLETALKKV